MPPVLCYYQDCTNTNKNKSVFSFPIKDEPRLKIWIKHSGNEKLASLGYEQLKRRFICEDHFNDRDIVRNSLRSRLFRNAVPLMYGLVKSPCPEMKNLEIPKVQIPQTVDTKKCMSKDPCVTTIRDSPLSRIDLPMIKDPPDKSFPCIDLPKIKDPPDKSFPCIDLPMLEDPSDTSLSCIDLRMIQIPQKVYTKKCMSKNPCVTSKRDSPLSCINLPLIKDPSDKSFPCIDLPMIKDPSDKSLSCIDLPMIKDPSDKSSFSIDLPMPEDSSSSESESSILDEPLYTNFRLKHSTEREKDNSIHQPRALPALRHADLIEEDKSRKSKSRKSESHKNESPKTRKSKSRKSESHKNESPKTRKSKSCKSESHKNESPKSEPKLYGLDKKQIVSIAMLQKKNMELKQRIRRLSMKSKKKKMMFFETLPFSSQAAKTLAAMQLRGPKKKEWTKEERDLSISIFSKSKSTYNHMKKLGIVLPARTTVLLWLQKMNSTDTTLESNENLQFDFVNCDSDQS